MTMQSALTSSKPASPDLPVGLGEQGERVRTVEALVAGGKQRADVAEPGRAEHGIGQRVRDDVAVRMTGETAVVLEAHAAEHQRHPRLERVGVHAQTDAEIAHRGHSDALCRERAAGSSVSDSICSAARS